MKKIRSLAILFAVSALVGAALAQSTSIQFTWTGNGNTGVPNCSATVTTSCISGYTLSGGVTGGTASVISSAISATALSYTLSPLPAPGNYTYTLAVNGKDPNGNAITGATATATVTSPLTLNAPVGFTAVTH